jgi:hypothetical protein
MRNIPAIPKATVQNYQPLFPCMFLRPHPQLSSVSIQYSNIIFMHIYFYQYSFRHTSLKDYNHHSLSKQKLWSRDKSLGLRGLFPLWSQVRALWLLIWWSLEAYMVVNFRARGISRNARKLTRTSTLN